MALYIGRHICRVVRDGYTQQRNGSLRVEQHIDGLHVWAHGILDIKELLGSGDYFHPLRSGVGFQVG